MPVVIDYSPVGAAGGLAQQVGNNASFMKTQQLGQEQQQLNMQASAQAAQQQEAQARINLAQQEQAQRGQPTSQTQGQNQNGGFPADATPYTDSQGNHYRVSPEQRQQLYNLQGGGNTDPDVLAASERQILGTPQLVPVQRPDGTTTYLPASQAALNDYRQGNQAIKTDQFNQKMGVNQDQFAAKMDQAEQTRQQNMQIAGAKVQAMMDIASQRNLSAGDKEKIGLSLQAHQSMVTQAKTHLQTAQQALSTVMANTPFDDKAVAAAKAAVQKASDDYDQAAQDLRSDVEKHIANLQAGQPINAKPPAADSKAAAAAAPSPALQSAKQLGAVNITDDAVAQGYMKAAGAGKVATQADVNQAMAEAKSDVTAAKAKLKAEGFLFTKSGLQL